jgi:hypothetical protein
MELAVDALLPDGALIDDGVCRVAMDGQCRDVLGERIEVDDTGDEVPRPLIHLFASRNLPIGSDCVERWVPQPHDTIRIASEETCLVLCVSRGELATDDLIR